jgi:hypothetical protein
MESLIISAIYYVFHLLYQVVDGISMCIIYNNDGVYDILWTNMLSSEKKLAYTCVRAKLVPPI